MFPYTWQVKKSTEERYPKLSPEDCSGKGTDHSLGTKRKKRSKKNRLDLRAKGENMTCCFAHLYARPPLSLSALCTSVNVSLFLSYFLFFILFYLTLHTRGKLNSFFSQSSFLFQSTMNVEQKNRIVLFFFLFHGGPFASSVLAPCLLSAAKSMWSKERNRGLRVHGALKECRERLFRWIGANLRRKKHTRTLSLPLLSELSVKRWGHLSFADNDQNKKKS